MILNNNSWGGGGDTTKYGKKTIFEAILPSQ